MNRLSRFAGTLQEGSLYVLLFLLPFSKAAIEIMFGFLLAGWLLERVNPATRFDTVWARPPLRKLAIAVAGFLAVCALSIAVSDYPSKSLSGFVNKWVEYLLFLVIAADVGARPGVVSRAAVVLACSSLFVIVEVATQWRFGRGIFRGYPLSYYGRATGPYENPIDLATYLMVILPVLLSFLLARRTRLRGLLWVLFVPLVLCFAGTEALGAWLGLGIGIMFMMRTAALRWSAVVLLIGVAITAGVLLHSRHHLSGTLSLSEIGKVDRWMMWQAAFGMIRDRPILGHGVNTFMANYLKYWVGGEQQPRYAHNCYLQVAAETGVVGLSLFLALLGAFFGHLVRRLRSMAHDNRIILSGLMAGLIAFAVQAGYDTNFYALRQAALFWVLAGLALGFSERPLTAVPGSPLS